MVKKAIEKLNTRIDRLIKDGEFERDKNKIKYKNKLMFSFNNKYIWYNNWRYYPDRIESIVKDTLKVTIFMEGKNFEILGSNIVNPPKSAKMIAKTFEKLTGIGINHISIGVQKDNLRDSTLKITKKTYDMLNEILKEEGNDKAVRINNRVSPIIRNIFNVHTEHENSNRNYSLLLKEIIESGNYTQEDVVAFADKISSGYKNTIVIEKQIKKQTQWLIDTMQLIVDEAVLDKSKAQELGSIHFMYTKNSISGPEELMEKILTDYGRNIFFGSPFLINTNKYVTSRKQISNSQFDILLVNQFNDLEVVELKRPDKPVLSYDPSRGKFYASRDLSIAISQAERYLSAVIRDNDDEYLICGKKIREYLNDIIGGTTSIEIVRPTALIILGSHQTVTEPYDKLNSKIREKVAEEEYILNGLLAYKELKNALKNIQIMTYSELIENARLRLS